MNKAKCIQCNLAFNSSDRYMILLPSCTHEICLTCFDKIDVTPQATDITCPSCKEISQISQKLRAKYHEIGLNSKPFIIYCSYHKQKKAKYYSGQNNEFICGDIFHSDEVYGLETLREELISSFYDRSIKNLEIAKQIFNEDIDKNLKKLYRYKSKTKAPTSIKF